MHAFEKEGENGKPERALFRLGLFYMHDLLSPARHRFRRRGGATSSRPDRALAREEGESVCRRSGGNSGGGTGGSSGGAAAVHSSLIAHRGDS